MNRTNVLRRNVLLAGTFAFAAFSVVPAWAANITLSNSNCAGYELTGTPPNQVLTCVTSTPPSVPGAPSGCSLSASPSVLPVGGGSVLLTASCSGVDAPTSFAWNGAGTQSSTTVASQSVSSVTASTSFSVTPSNANGAGNTASVFVTVQSPPPPVGQVLSCPGFANTKVIDAPIPPAGTVVRYFTYSSVFGSGGTTTSAGFGAQDAVILRFTMPVGEPTLNLSWTETGTGSTGQASPRTAVLSTAPCDWSGANAVYFNNVGQQGSVKLASVAVSRSRNLLVTGGQLYYLSLSNFQNGQNVCVDGPNGTCNLFITFENPL
jgi:hypothetical protein